MKKKLLFPILLFFGILCAQTNVTGVYEVGAGNSLDIDLEIVMDYGWTVTISLGSVEPGSEVNEFYADSNTMTVTDKDGKVIYKR